MIKPGGQGLDPVPVQQHMHPVWPGHCSSAGAGRSATPTCASTRSEPDPNESGVALSALDS